MQLKHRLLGTCLGKKKRDTRTQNEAEELQSLEVKPGFFSPAEPGAPKCGVPSQTERRQLRNIERETIQVVKRQKRFSESVTVEDRHPPDGQLSGFQ